jgi:hypothetical protein
VVAVPEADLDGEGFSEFAAGARVRGTARRQRLRAVRVATAVIAVLTAAIVIPLALLPGSVAASGQHQRPAHRSAESATMRTTIAINPQYGMTFAPAPASLVPKMTAQQDWTRFARLNRSSSTVIPSGVHAQLGLFTQSDGPADFPGASRLVKTNGNAYIAYNELAYGYSSPSKCVTMNPMMLPPPDAHCISWTFLNANTGEQIASTFQKIGHWHWLFNPKGL